MAEGFQVRVTNGPAFAAAMGEIRDSVDRPEAALNAGTAELVSAAVAIAPRLTGRMAAAHRADPARGRTARVVVDTPYAGVQHWGWSRHNIAARPWILTAWRNNETIRARMAQSIQADIDKAAAKT